ncbi:MAG: hypothetical protein J6V72_19795 [Kiritimatiellae bacterium]|nr:hypothetical protein [Kiritimatiellia bacterium]
MSGEKRSEEFRTLDMIDARHVMEVCGDAARTERLVAWMDELVDENVTLMSALAEGGDERRSVRLEHLASQISVYRRIKDAANRALDSDGGQPPPVGDPESAAEAPL